MIAEQLDGTVPRGGAVSSLNRLMLDRIRRQLCAGFDPSQYHLLSQLFLASVRTPARTLSRVWWSEMTEALS